MQRNRTWNFHSREIKWKIAKTKKSVLFTEFGIYTTYHSECLEFNSKLLYGGKKENVTCAQEEKQSVETNPKMILMSKSADKDFKAAYFYAQGHRGKYAYNEWKGNKSQRSRNYTQKIPELKNIISEI